MKHIRKLTSWLLTIALIFALLPVVAIRARAAWSGEGNGTSESPYKIGTKAQLEKFRDIVNGENGEERNSAACAILKVNINLENKVWAPIGNSDTYTGTFDGQGHSITGLYVSGGDYSGLFGKIGSSGTVQNVSVSGTVKGSGSNVGGVVGDNGGTVTNCYNTGTVDGNFYVGGVVGYNRGTVTNCYNTGTVDGDYYVGGVVGYNTSTVTNCYNTGSVTGTGDYVGGVVGRNSGLGTVTNCYNTCSVTGKNYVGGVVGDNSRTVINCYNTGAVNGETKVGGVVGTNTDTVIKCYNTGAVNGKTKVGGVVGNNTATVTNCYYRTYSELSGIGYGEGTVMAVPNLDKVVFTWSALYDALQASSVIALGADLTYGTGGGDYENYNLVVPESRTVSLDLTGHVIDRGLENEDAVEDGSVITVNGNLEITDSSTRKTGKITGGNTSSGGGVCVNSGSFTLEGGTISGNRASASGGGVYINNLGSFTLKGGTISGNRASVNGGGVFCDGTFKLSGGATISGNYKGTDDTATDYNNNVYLNSGKTITVTDALTNTTPIGVTMYNSTGTITSGLGTIVSENTPRGTAVNFTSDNAAYGVALNASKEAYLGTREGKPTATFAADGADSGELSGLNAGASYSISGAGFTTATDITADTNGKYTIASGMTEGTLSIVKNGDGSTTVDSNAQTITVTKAETPNLAVTQPTTGGTGSVATDSTHEYSTDGTSWTSCTGALTGLTPGIYYVRVKASGATLASDNQELTIAVSYKTVTSSVTIGSGVAEMATVLPPGVPPIAVSGITEDFAKSLLSNAEELAEVMGGAKLTVTLDMKDISATVSADNKLKLGNKAKEFGGSNALIGLFLDISLFKQIGTNPASPVYDTNGKKVSMVLTVPEALRNINSRITRTFFILRMHGDNIDKVGEGTGNEIPFDSDLFSTYALAYSDKQNSSGGGGTTPTYYTVRFEMNGHGTAVASRKVIAGQKVPKPEDPEEEGYTFGDWYSDAGLTSEYDFSSPVRKSMTLYARWEEIRFTVSFDLDGKGSIETQWVRKNGMAEKPDDPSADGYTFDGWYIDPDCTKLYDFSTPVTKDITLYAKWIKDVLIYRLYNPNSGAHLFTSNGAEKDNLVLIGWEYEGVAWTAPASSNTPVYRVYNPNSGEHHYTMNADEKDILATLGWNYEGISWYSDENQGTPLYRLYNPNATGQYAAGAHHYTKDVEERDYLIAAGWNDEGIGWYGI